MWSTVAVSQPTLRDAKRAATSAGLALAALRLAEERGLDGFTIDDIAAGANYSRRTFANHFAGKEDAVVAAAFLGFDDLDRLAAQLPERMHLTLLVRAVQEWPEPVTVGLAVADSPATGLLTPGEIVDALEQIVLSPIIIDTLEAAERLAPLVEANPSLLPALLTRKNAMAEGINSLIARIDGIAVATPYLPILLGALAGAITTFDQLPGVLCPVPSADEPTDRRDHIHLTFDYLRHGFAR